MSNNLIESLKTLPWFPASRFGGFPPGAGTTPPPTNGIASSMLTP
jgi:hypothetical protein